MLLEIPQGLYMMCCFATGQRRMTMARGRAGIGAQAMAKRKGSAGSAITPAILSVLLVALVVITVYLFAANVFPPPPAITDVGHEVDHQYNLTLYVAGIVFILSQLGLAWVIFRYRDQGQKAHYTHGNNTFEVLWTTATIVLFLGLGLMARKAWAEVHFTEAAANALQIEVTANQFVFNFRYPGPDGKFGRLDPKYISSSTGNPVGVDPTDPAGKDDIVVPTLTVPVDREVELLIRSQDVTHAFFVRELRLKQDAVPGMIIRIHFTATVIGDYELACAELCGANHNTMRTLFQVMSQADFDKWLKDQAANQ
jgi:cytochrome c oxidase subunit 2